MNLEDEVGYEDIDTSEPSSPASIDDDDDYSDDGLDVSTSRKRGKGVSWNACLDSKRTLETTDSVVQDARGSDLKKLGASTHNSHVFACKIKGCPYKRKYKQDLGKPFQIYHSGIHTHFSDDTSIDHRGLSGPQKSVIEEAFGQRKKSARDIIEFFRAKRSLLTSQAEIDLFSPDPKKKKLNNYIQSYKKKNGETFNPTPNDLELWCQSHGPSTANVLDDVSYNTPFVLDYTLVSSILATCYIDIQMC